MITKINEESFIFICTSCGNKEEIRYDANRIRIASRNKRTAIASINCECGSMESFSSDSKDFNIVKIFCKLLLNEDKE